jgi:hypothetical protein
MSDFLWYSRLLVWVGCGALFVEAIAGRSFGYLTLVAVLFLVVGFAGFLGALALEGRSLSWLTALAEVPEGIVAAPGERTPGGDVEHRVEQPSTSAARPAASGIPVPTVADAGLRAGIAPAAERAVESPRRVETEDLTAASRAVGTLCPHCGKELNPGQIGAVCWACGAVHHASCWTENRFHCATPGCAGSGSLEAPR